MSIDIPRQLSAIERAVEKIPEEDGAGERVGVTLRRSYDTSMTDVWDAMTDPVRVARWFMPLSGDLRVGGTFQLAGNASGEILECAPPELLRVTWGGPASVVELRLAAQGERTELELVHTVPIEMAQSGAGALWVGPGWDGAFMGLALYLDGDLTSDPATMASSPEVQQYSQQSVHSWAATVADSGTATANQLEEATAISLAQFAPDLTESSPDQS